MFALASSLIVSVFTREQHATKNIIPSPRLSRAQRDFFDGVQTMERRARPQEPGEPNLSPGIIELGRGVFSDILQFFFVFYCGREEGWLAIVAGWRFTQSRTMISRPVRTSRLGDKRSQMTKKLEL